MRKVWVEDCQLPGVVYDHALARMPEPTESKWQVVHTVSYQVTTNDVTRVHTIRLFVVDAITYLRLWSCSGHVQRVLPPHAALRRRTAAPRLSHDDDRGVLLQAL